jgi:hypothetical protein
MSTLMDKIEALQLKIADAATLHGSLESYLNNNLADLAVVVGKNGGGQDLERASRALMRFCTESLDWDTPLYRECIAVAEEGRQLSAIHRT